MKNIFSFDHDQTTDRVIEFIRYFSPKIELKRILDCSYQKFNCEIDNASETLHISKSNDDIIKIERESSWLRRGIINFNLLNIETGISKIKSHLNKEFDLVLSFFYDYSLILGSYKKEVDNNRLTNIIVAKDCGFKIPPTLITTERKELLKFYRKNNLKIVSKPIHNLHLFFSNGDDTYISNGTELLSFEFITKIEKSFPISLFQGYIEKEVELRVFVLNGKIYTMAIFSQLDEQTKIDYRNYNKIKPNRNVPFNLPIPIQNQILKFMKKIGLLTGSIDLILTPNNDFYFLEVNPTGQFGWLSTDCNYYIEKEIAKTLIENEI